GSDDGTARIWEIASGAEARVLRGHGASVRAVAFSPDGRFVATGSSDTTAILWSAPGDGRASVHSTLEEAWKTLGGKDPLLAAAFAETFLKGPSESLPFLAARVGLPLPPNTVRDAIRRLDADEFEVRERASETLIGLGEAVVAEARKTLKESPSPEVASRLEEILERVEGRDSPPFESGPVLQELRAAWILERIGSPEAVRILEAVRDHSMSGWVRSQAGESLKRIRPLALDVRRGGP
ncbi:MAG: hypothetical protein AAB215_07900, partial [Planctomycetota bacterium]